MNLEPAEMTDRLLRALERPSLKLWDTPPARLLLHREPFRFDFERVVDEAVRAACGSKSAPAPSDWI